MHTIKQLAIMALATSVITACAPPDAPVINYDVVILNGRVMDPDSGMDEIANVGILDGGIEIIKTGTIVGGRVIDAAGLVVAPGFVDLHAHGQSEESFLLMAQDGVTSAFELEVGTADVAAWYAERAPGQVLNYGVSVGHIPARMQLLGDAGTFLPSGPGGSEPATEEQIAEIKSMIEDGLAAGAIAVGFGLAYTPAATTEEFATMMRVVADQGTTAHIHVRTGLDGLAEAIAVAQETGASLHVVHANSSGDEDIVEFLAMVDEARSGGQDVTTEAYPYEAGMTSIASALFDDWESWDEEQFPIHQWAATGERLTRESFARYREQDGLVIIHGRTEAMTRTAIESPLTMIASDGLIAGGRGHPRTSGTYAKVLGKYARDEGVITLMDALRKMTIEPAKRLQSYVPSMRLKGRVSFGADADITIFDPAKVTDRSTYTDPTLTSDGIEYVLVNGELVVENGSLIPGARPGKAIRTQ